MPLIISIEGNIGAGKSTILEQLKSHFAKHALNVVFMPEPVDIWNTVVDETGETILAKYYADPHKYAFPFQIMAYSTRLSMLQTTISENPTCDVIICERSLEADRNIFAKMLYADNMIEHVNYQIYELLYNSTAMKYAVDSVVYMNADPAKCIERIHKRNRGGESKISINYLSECRAYYDNWLYSGEREFGLLELDTNPDVEYNGGDLGEKWIQMIVSHTEELFIKKRGRQSIPSNDTHVLLM